jgi:gluconolactonase
MAQVEPDPAAMILDQDPYVVLDERFAPFLVPGGRAERLWTGGGWTEGPAWFDAGHLIWSDIPGNRILRWDEGTGAVTIFRQPSNGANGHTIDHQGRLIHCEGLSRRVTRTEHDGSITVLASHHAGRRLRAPNDVVVKSDGTVWFTDPSYGSGPLEPGETEVEGKHVYRLDPATGALTQMTDDFVMPNGLAFSRDESLLYIVDTGSTEGPENANHIRRFRVTPDGLTGGEVFVASRAERFDGLRLDSTGKLWAADVDGVHVYDPDGTLIGKIALPERAANLTFGRADDGMLYITATTSLYRVPVNARRP